MKTSRMIQVTQYVRVTVDKEKFDGQFMSEFRRYHYDFDTLEEHMEHLAQMHARGLCDDHDFIEGYGPAKDMGIKFYVTEVETDIIGEAEAA